MTQQLIDFWQSGRFQQLLALAIGFKTLSDFGPIRFVFMPPRFAVPLALDCVKRLLGYGYGNGIMAGRVRDNFTFARRVSSWLNTFPIHL
jgi:hypothetical protein